MPGIKDDRAEIFRILDESRTQNRIDKLRKINA